MLRSIEEEWKEYTAKIFSGMKVSQVQYEETKKAFFAGAFIMLNQLQTIGTDKISEDEGVVHLENLKREIEHFFRSLVHNHARKN